MTTISVLPLDLLHQIASYTSDPPTLIHLSLTCKSLYHAITDDTQLWHRLAHTYFLLNTLPCDKCTVNNKQRFVHHINICLQCVDQCNNLLHSDAQQRSSAVEYFRLNAVFLHQQLHRTEASVVLIAMSRLQKSNSKSYRHAHTIVHCYNTECLIDTIEQHSDYASKLLHASYCVTITEDCTVSKVELEQHIDMIVERTHTEIQQSDATTVTDLLQCIRTVLYVEYGFHGDASMQYYNSNNSYIHQLLERKRALPITLCILFVIVCHKLCIPAIETVSCCGTPSHFLVNIKSHDNECVYIDCFNGFTELSQNQVLSMLHMDVSAVNIHALNRLHNTPINSVLMRCYSNLINSFSNLPQTYTNIASNYSVLHQYLHLMRRNNVLHYDTITNNKLLQFELDGALVE